MTATAALVDGTPARVARLSYFFPAHNEEANLEALVDEALEALPALAETFEIIAVNDGSKDRTGEIRCSGVSRRCSSLHHLGWRRMGRWPSSGPRVGLA